MEGEFDPLNAGLKHRSIDQKGRVSDASFSSGLRPSSGLRSDFQASDFDAKKGGIRGKTSLRLKYEAEVLLIRKKYGTLEDIRNMLGLSARKMCQLLLVDPSAWNRWTKSGEGAPPHIYRALEWYLYLQEKNPTLDQRFWLSQITHPVAPASDPKFEQTLAQVQKLEADIHLLKSEQRTAQSMSQPIDNTQKAASSGGVLLTPLVWALLSAANLLGWLGAWLLLK